MCMLYNAIADSMKLMNYIIINEQRTTNFYMAVVIMFFRKYDDC